MYRWLHISDIHFDPTADGVHTQLLRNTLPKYIEGLRNEGVSFNALFITGDLRFAPYRKSESDDRDAVVSYIKEIAKSAGIIDMLDIYMVPGNHDVTNNKVRMHVAAGEKDDEDNISKGTIDKSCLEYFSSNFSFYKACELELYGQSFLPSTISPHFVSKTSHFYLIHINTAILSHNKLDDRDMRIGTAYLENIIKSECDDMDLPKIAMGHHGFHFFDKDRNDIQNIFKTNNINLYLCGHAHSLKSDINKSVCEIAAGCMKKDDSEVDASFIIGELDDLGRASFAAHSYIRGAWTVDSSFKLEFPYDNGYVPLLGTRPKNKVSQGVKVEKITYKMPSSYIHRKAIPRKILSEYAYYLSLFEKEYVSLYDACLSNQYIVLIGEAGCGKSTDLKYLAAKMSTDSTHDIYPIIVPLNLYPNSKQIYDYVIEKNYTHIEANKIFMLFDGYDEIESGNVSDFDRNLNDFINNHPKINIVISTRGNFYKSSSSSDGVQTEPFAKFKNNEYGLVPLDYKDINKYLDDQCIDIKAFRNECNMKGLADMLQIPFYLIHIAKIYSGYKVRNTLPGRSELMGELVKSSFDRDNVKYKNTTKYQLEEIENEVNISLEKLAFAMQLTRRNYLTRQDYQKLVDDLTIRSHLQYNGVLVREDNERYRFEHNNFQEYLAAKYLTKFSHDEILNFITSRKGVLNANWVNTLSYFLPMLNNDDLFNWIAENAPNTVCYFESDKLSEAQRFNIFNKLMTAYKEKNMWLHYGYVDLQKFSNYFASKKSVLFLIDEISMHTHYCSLANALNVLGNLDSLFDLEDAARDALIRCCESAEVRTDEKEDALYVLGNLKLNNPTLNTHLFELFENTTDAKERAGMYRYLILTNQVDAYVDFFLNGTVIKIQHPGLTIHTSVDRRLLDGLSVISELSAIKKTLEFLTLDKMNSEFANGNSVIQNLINKSITHYQEGHTEVYSFVLNALINSINRHAEYASDIWLFFINTETRRKAYEDIFNESEDTILNFRFSRFIDNTCEDYMEAAVEAYKVNKCGNSFLSLVQSLTAEDPKFFEYQALIKEKEGIIVEPRNFIDYSALMNNGKQCHFNALFDKRTYLDLVDELVTFSGFETLTCNQLRDIEYMSTREKYELHEVKWDLIRWCGNEQCILPIKSHLDGLSDVDWEFFLISKIVNYLQHISYDKVSISEAQKKYISDYCIKKASNINFETCVKHNEDGSLSYTMDNKYVSFLIQYFSIDCEEKTLRELLMYPFLYYFDDKGNFRESYNNSFGVIKDMLDEQKITQQVRYNLANKELSPRALERHLIYCKDKKIVGAQAVALSACLNSKSNFTKNIALDYLFKVFGEEYVLRNLLQDADDNILLEIGNRCINTYDEQLIDTLIERAIISKDPTEFLPILIRLQTYEGLKMYLEIAKAINSVPDYSGNHIHHLTESIEYINKIELLPMLIELAVLRFNSTFKDGDFRSVYTSLLNAISRIAKEGHYAEVIANLTKLLDAQPNNLDMKRFCNTIIEEVKRDESINAAKIWTIDEIKKLSPL